MSRYYCPFCSNGSKFHRTRSDGVLICSQCGDPLTKKPFLNARRIIGVLAALSFLAPLTIMINFVIDEFTEEKIPKISESIEFFTTFK